MNCYFCEKKIIGEGVKFQNENFCNDVCLAELIAKKEFIKIVKEKIIGNKEVIKKMVEITSQCMKKFPKESRKERKEFLADEFAKIWNNEIEGA